MKCFSSHLAASGRLVRKIITSREPQTASCPSYHSTPFPCLPHMHDICRILKTQRTGNYSVLIPKARQWRQKGHAQSHNSRTAVGCTDRPPEPADQLLLGPFPTKLLLSCSHSGTLCFPPLNCAWALSLGQVQLLGMLTLTDRDILRGWH